jgi:hypothetical protein
MTSCSVVQWLQRVASTPNITLLHKQSDNQQGGPLPMIVARLVGFGTISV